MQEEMTKTLDQKPNTFKATKPPEKISKKKKKKINMAWNILEMLGLGKRLNKHFTTKKKKSTNHQKIRKKEKENY